MKDIQTGFSCWQLDPVAIADGLGTDAQLLEVLIPQGGVETARAWGEDLFRARGIESVLTVLCMPSGVHWDAEVAPVPWEEGLAVLDALQPVCLRVVGVPDEADPGAFAMRVAGQLRHILPFIERRKLVLAYENHGEASATVLTIRSLVDAPQFRLLLDPLNAFLAGEQPQDVITALLPHAEYLHIKDVKLPESGPGHAACCCVGDGDAPWADILPMLGAAGRALPHVFELPGVPGDAVANYRRSLAAFRKLAAASAG